MKQRIKKVYKKLPPHTYEAHPVANAGQASKPFIIAVITIVAVVALTLLLLFSDQLVGKAFFTGQANSAGAELTAPAYENQPFSLKIKANTAAEVSALGFTLNLPKGMTCADLLLSNGEVQNLLAWELKANNKCTPNTNQVVFEYATLGPEKSGTFDVAQINFAGMPAGTYQFTFESFAAYDAQTQDVIKIVLDPTVEVVLAPFCGDGEVDSPQEQCDDGNTVNGDGCSEQCLPEIPAVCGDGVVESTEKCDDGSNNGNPNYCNLECTGITTPVCGNGVKEVTEQCEDGNNENGDGCSSTCTSEQQQVQVSCGDGVVDAALGELCDDGNTKTRDGCFSTCKPEDGWSCTGQPSVCVQTQIQQQVCGNGIKEGTEQCDDGNTGDGDGCTNCVTDYCGDGDTNYDIQLNAMDECDDDNNVNGDGCSANCLRETGWSCAGEPSLCNVVPCGDGIVDETEQCDDGSTANGDGCSAICEVESGWSCDGNNPTNCQVEQCIYQLTSTEGCSQLGECAGSRKTCTQDNVWGACNKLPSAEICDQKDNDCDGQTDEGNACQLQQQVCGNRLKEGNEECDDGNKLTEACPNYGQSCQNICNADCKLVVVQGPFCGDGVVQYSGNIVEGCDDRNTVNGDGCSSTCALEQQQVQGYCGDGAVDANLGELCDDRNTETRDGCSSTCNLEEGWLCTGQPSACTQAVQTQIQQLTVQGTKITLTDVDTQSAFATKVTATEDFSGTEVIIYTVLYGPGNKVLSIKSEKVEAGLAQRQEYTATVNYPRANVKSKSVIVYDVEQNPLVFGQLQKSYE